MARLAPRVIFSPMFDLQTKVIIPLICPSTVWSVQQSLHQSPAAPGFYKLDEKTEMTSVLQRPENRSLYEKLSSGAAESPLDEAGGIIVTFYFTI